MFVQFKANKFAGMFIGFSLVLGGLMSPSAAMGIVECSPFLEENSSHKKAETRVERVTSEEFSRLDPSVKGLFQLLSAQP